ncbi:MAG: DNA polymerase III subunit delta [Devosiaceae bacterium]
MAEIKGQAADRFVSKPDPKLPIILVHGPDRGRVSMRSKAILKALGGDNPDPMSMVELDSTILDSEPSHLAEEADSVPMFGGHKTIFVRMDEPKNLVKPIEVLLSNPPSSAAVVIAAGDLKKSHPLRSRIEKAATGASIACYAAEARDIAGLLVTTAQKHSLTVQPEAQKEIVAMLGADHALSATEIEKLCLYALQDGQISLEHVHASLVDGASHALSDVSDAAFAGRRKFALEALEYALRDGLEASVITQNLLRHGQALERMRFDIDRGASADSVMARARPPVFFKRKPATQQALSRWSMSRLRSVLSYLDEELAATRLTQVLKNTRLERQVLRIASEAEHAGR